MFICLSHGNLEKQHVYKKIAIKLKNNEVKLEKLDIFAEFELEKINLENLNSDLLKYTYLNEN